uniref:Uncharacterized protein n=1 Tax=Timema monikensis TaxID=170555 RepID=A0A7R9EGG3_9NEOP|nr:unnamed protein product [Timema monikensis]
MLILEAGIVLRKLRTFPPKDLTNAMEMEPSNMETESLLNSFHQINEMVRDELDEINTSKGQFCNVKVEEHFYEIEPFSEEHSSETSVIKAELATNLWGIPYKIAAGKTLSPSSMSTLRRPDGTMMTFWQDSVDLLMEKTLLTDHSIEIGA